MIPSNSNAELDFDFGEAYDQLQSTVRQFNHRADRSISAQADHAYRDSAITLQRVLATLFTVRPTVLGLADHARRTLDTNKPNHRHAEARRIILQALEYALDGAPHPVHFLRPVGAADTAAPCACLPAQPREEALSTNPNAS